jgi:hypothetical protein
VLPIDLIGLFQARDAIRAAQRATAGWTQVIAEAPRDTLVAFAFTAFIDCHIAETLEKCPVDSPEFLTALRTLHSSLL